MDAEEAIETGGLAAFFLFTALFLSTIESLDVAEGLDGRIPEPALLFAMKLHSGRKADTRDLVVISLRADFNRIERHLHRGDPKKLKRQIEMVLDQLQQEGFEDSFKGVFRKRVASRHD